ncbi:hypothetical protein C8Q74DRAFT_1223851, partial [Fomes fomentarius]
MTIGDEIRLFWRRPLSGGAGMYFFIKYVLLLSNLYILCILPMRYNSVQAEKSIVRLVLVEIFLPGVFMSLRAYALSKTKWLGLVILLLHFVPVGANVMHHTQSLTVLVGDGLCYIYDDDSNTQRSLILADLLGIATIWHVRSTTHRVRGSLLLTVLLRDDGFLNGSTYVSFIASP